MSVQEEQTFLKMRTENFVKVARIEEVMTRRRLLILGELPSSSVIKIIVPKHAVLMRRIINIIRDNFKHGRRYAGKV